MSKSVQVEMKQSKICKSCVRFDAVDAKQGTAVLKDVYLSLDAYDKLGNPQKITVTVSL